MPFHTHSQPPVLMGVRCLYQNAPILLMPKQAPQAMSFTGNLTSKPRSAVGNFPFREHHDDPIIQLGSSRIRGVLRGPQGRWLHDSAHNRINDGIFAPVSVERPSLRAAYRRVMVHHAQEPHWGHCEEGERARLRESKRGEDEESERLTGTVGGRAHRFRWLSHVMGNGMPVKSALFAPVFYAA